MSSLYEINKSLMMYHMDIDPETGEWLNEDELTNLEMERDEKIENMLLWAKNIRAEASAIKEESVKLNDRYKRKEHKAEKIEEYVAKTLNGEKFETPRVKIDWRKSEKVIIPDEYKVPDKFVNCTIERKPVKTEIKKYLKSIEGTDETCDWASLEKRLNMSVK